MNHHLLTGITTPALLGLARRHGLAARPAAWGRFTLVLATSLWVTAAASLERRRCAKALEEAPDPDDPLIIVGHWRTGSTYLHQLLALDPLLHAPTVFQCSLPDAFLVAGRYVRPVMSAFLPPTRPMDNVRLAPDEPMEDEFALLRLSGSSPLERLFFARRPGYFLSSPDGDAGEGERWERSLLLFLKKLRLASNRRIVLKNPFHSFRIPRLRRLLPRAKFICIHRDPRRVIPSTVRMWEIIGRQNSLGVPPGAPSAEEAVEVFRRLADTVRTDLAALPPGERCELRFEDLERSPAETLRAVYGRLGIPFTAEHEERVRRYAAEQALFSKNTYPLDAAGERLISARLADYLAAHGYGPDGAGLRP